MMIVLSEGDGEGTGHKEEEEKKFFEKKEESGTYKRS